MADVLLLEVSHYYNRNPVLFRLCASISSGSSVAVLGSNGSGKSTLLSIIAGLLPPSSGKVEIDGLDVRRVRSSRGQSCIGYLGCELLLYRHLSVRENLQLHSSLISGFSAAKKDNLDLLKHLMEKFNLTGFSNKSIRECSFGMARRVALARVFLNSPQLLVLDEPFNGLDAKSRDILSALLLEYRNTGGTLIIAGHDNELKDHASHSSPLIDTVFELRRGKIANI